MSHEFVFSYLAIGGNRMARPRRTEQLNDPLVPLCEDTDALVAALMPFLHLDRPQF